MFSPLSGQKTPGVVSIVSTLRPHLDTQKLHCVHTSLKTALPPYIEAGQSTACTNYTIYRAAGYYWVLYDGLIAAAAHRVAHKVAQRVALV